MMKFTYDPAKNAANKEKHTISLEEATNMDFDTAVVKPDNRKEYGEDRFAATGYIHNRLYVMVFTPREKSIRIISLRKANARERKKYGKETNRVH